MTVPTLASCHWLRCYACRSSSGSSSLGLPLLIVYALTSTTYGSILSHAMNIFITAGTHIFERDINNKVYLQPRRCLDISIRICILDIYPFAVVVDINIQWSSLVHTSGRELFCFVVSELAAFSLRRRLLWFSYCLCGVHAIQIQSHLPLTDGTKVVERL